MKLLIRDKQYTRDWLLGSADGQSLLAAVKQTGPRPRCLCTSARPEMYIAQRGNLTYLARMPGTAASHHEDCQSHVVQESYYESGFDSPDLVLSKLLHLTDVCDKTWVEARVALLHSSRNIEVDGTSLFDNLLVPKFFIKASENQLTASYNQFLRRVSEDGVTRRWVFGIFKSASHAKYSEKILLKHMPGIPFWMKPAMAGLLPRPEIIGDKVAVVLFSIRPSANQGAQVIEMAVRLLTRKTADAAKINEPLDVQKNDINEAVTTYSTLSGDDKIARAAVKLGMTADADRRLVIETLIDRFLKST